MSDPYRTEPFKNPRHPCKICQKLTGMLMPFQKWDPQMNAVRPAAYHVCSDECADQLGGALSAEIQTQHVVGGKSIMSDMRASSSSTASPSDVDIEHETDRIYGGRFEP